MASLYDDPVYTRTHFLGRVASEDLGIAHEKQSWSKARNRRQHHDLGHWGAHWVQPSMTASFDDDGDSSSDSSSDEQEEKQRNTHSSRARSSTLPNSQQSSILVDSTFLHQRRRSQSEQILPPTSLKINTLQPLRLSSTDLCALSINARSASEAVRIQLSESDGSCHGDAGDQDPEAQLAAGIIKLREAKRASARSRRQSLRAAESDIDVQAHNGSFVLRLAEAMLDFGTSALERLSTSQEEPNEETSLAPKRRLSTTPRALAAEAEVLTISRRSRRRQQESRSANVSRSTSTANLSSIGKMARTLSMPRLSPLLSVLSPSASLTMTTATDTQKDLDSDPGFSQPCRKISGYGLNTYADVPSAFAELHSLDNALT